MSRVEEGLCSGKGERVSTGPEVGFCVVVLVGHLGRCCDDCPGV